jgi:hypothetical protein
MEGVINDHVFVAYLNISLFSIVGLLLILLIWKVKTNGTGIEPGMRVLAFNFVGIVIHFVPLTYIRYLHYWQGRNDYYITQYTDSLHSIWWNAQAYFSFSLGILPAVGYLIYLLIFKKRRASDWKVKERRKDCLEKTK